MKKRQALALVGIIAAAGGGAAFVTLSHSSERVVVASDPRQEAPLVQVALVAPTKGVERSFTGQIQARVQTNLGFRVPGKIVERLVDVGQQVKAGQALMRIDDSDLQLALTAKRNAAAAARAVFVQASADEKRYATLVKGGLAASPQRYEQAKAALDTAQAQLAAAEAEANVAQNEATYSTLVADADGTIVATLGEPGQVVQAGQAVIQLAEAGPREAVVSLPETIRPELGSLANASIYGSAAQPSLARLRQISNAADTQTRTYEARYVLDGPAAAAPLGSTVTIAITNTAKPSEVSVPIGALVDDGSRTGVWVIDRSTSSVQFAPVVIKRLGQEDATVTGVGLGLEVVALGAHLLQDGATVRTASLNTGAGQ